MKYSIKDFFSKCDQIWLATFTEEIFNGKLQFLCSVIYYLTWNSFGSFIQLWRHALREKCPNTEFFQVCIFPHSHWIRKDTPYSVRVRMRENTDQRKLRVCTFSTQWWEQKMSFLVSWKFGINNLNAYRIFR